MKGIEPLLNAPTDDLRRAIRDQVFKPFGVEGVSYQANDFEVIDYNLYDLSPDLPMLRGPAVPKPSLERGRYFCVVGAAQTFGRLVENPWPALLSKAIGLPVLNLGRGGAGPENFLEPAMIELMRNARFIILQAMSGRSVGCGEYPGGRLVELNGKITKINRLDLLEQMYRKNPMTAYVYINRWNRSYLDLYSKLREVVDRPTLLLWVSDRQTGDWSPELILKMSRPQKPNWGSFPHLVGQELFDDVARLFGARHKFLHTYVPNATFSRVTGDPAPHFSNTRDLHGEFRYYPSASDHVRLAEELMPWVQRATASTTQLSSPSHPRFRQKKTSETSDIPS